MTTAPYDESVREAVARETARRKRVFLAFLGLLLIPIAIGAYALSKAPTEIEKVATDVTPLVTSRVAGEITERVTSDVSARNEPLIRQNVAREITTVVEPRLASVANDITQLQTSVQRTSELVQGVAPQLAAVSALSNRLSAFNADQDRQSRELASNRETLALLTRRIAEIHGYVKETNGELKSLSDRVTALEKQRVRPVPVPAKTQRP
jgi:chromosome segregation ATPase